MHPDIATHYAQQIICDRHLRAARARLVRDAVATTRGGEHAPGPRPRRWPRMRLPAGTFAARPRRAP